MFDIEDDASRREKCFTTVAQLPAWVDSKQIPSTRSPFSTIRNHSFAHTVEAILPAEAYESVQAALDARIANPEYARVFMAPSALLEHEFFNAYIKAGMCGYQAKDGHLQNTDSNILSRKYSHDLRRPVRIRHRVYVKKWCVRI